MNSIKDAKKKINWTKPSDQEHRLETTDGPIASIKFGENDALAESGDGKWRFFKHGFLNPHVIVTDVESGKHLARFEAAMNGGGMLELTDGRHFKFAANTWKAEWRWLATAGDELVTFDFIGYAVDSSPEGGIEIHEKGREFNQLPMLVVLGCYLIHLIAESQFE